MDLNALSIVIPIVLTLVTLGVRIGRKLDSIEQAIASKPSSSKVRVIARVQAKKQVDAHVRRAHKGAA